MENKQLITKLGNCGLCGIIKRVYLESDGNLTDYLCKSCIKKIKNNYDKLMKELNKKQNRFELLEIASNRIVKRIPFEYILEQKCSNSKTILWNFIDCYGKSAYINLGCFFNNKFSNKLIRNRFEIIERKGVNKDDKKK